MTEYTKSVQILFFIASGLLLLLVVGTELFAQAETPERDLDESMLVDFNVGSLEKTFPSGTTDVPELEMFLAEDFKLDIQDLSVQTSLATDTNLFYSFNTEVARTSYRNSFSGDFNGDGLTDFLFENDFQLHMFEQQSDRTQFNEVLNTGGVSYFLSPWALGDFNNDSKTDIVFYSNLPGENEDIVEISIMYFNGGGQFETRSFDYPVEIAGSIDNVEHFDSLDVNADGFNDVLIFTKQVGTDQSSLYIMPSDGVGGFEEVYLAGSVARVSDRDDYYLSSLFDAEMEQLIQTSIFFDSETLEQKFQMDIQDFLGGVLTNTQTISLTVAPPASASPSTKIDFVDHDKDGLKDVVLASYFSTHPNQPNPALSYSELMVIKQISAGEFEQPVSISSDGFAFNSLRGLRHADFNHDGNLDAAVQTNGHLFILFLDSDNQVIDSLDLVPRSYVGDLFLIEDLDDDSYTDIILGNTVFYHTTFQSRAYLSSLQSRFYIYRPFFDDFSDPNSGWPIFSSGNISYGYADGRYNIVNHNADFFGAVVQSFPAYEYVYQAQASKTGGARGGYGILLEVDDSFDYFKGLLLFPNFEVVWLIDVAPDGTLQLLEEYRNFPITGSKDWYQFRADRRNGVMQVFVDPVQGGPSGVGFSTSYTGNNEHNPHRVGFITLPLDDGFTAWFDNVSFELVE